jgi:hypothetical protein
LKIFLHTSTDLLRGGSSLAVYFHANVLSGMVGADAKFSERRRDRESG